MNMPGFSADGSLYKAKGHYRTGIHDINSSKQIFNVTYPAAMAEEVIEIFGEAPPELPWGWGPGGWGGPRHSSTPVSGPSVGGGGGGGFPVDEGGGTLNMDKACDKAGANCFPISTANARCAVLRCRKSYCSRKDPKTGAPIKCTSDEVVRGKKAEAEYKGAQCDMFPCVARPSSSSNVTFI